MVSGRQISQQTLPQPTAILDASFVADILFVTVDAIIGNQAFWNGRCHTCSSLGLDQVETGYNFLLVIDTHKMLTCLLSAWFGLRLVFICWQGQYRKL